MTSLKIRRFSELAAKIPTLRDSQFDTVVIFLNAYSGINSQR